MLTKKLTISNKLGLHARASTKLVQHATRYASDIQLATESKTVAAKSIMGVMLLAASRGTEVELIINGSDEIEAMADLESLIMNKFGEEE
ncbi:MAG: HPr family phosphocarrier protein [Gammaproteobacteria bacterium]|nr:HPr family phosphocarrier protein [Gammaproteobacteria bacterium]